MIAPPISPTYYQDELAKISPSHLLLPIFNGLLQKHLPNPLNLPDVRPIFELKFPYYSSTATSNVGISVTLVRTFVRLSFTCSTDYAKAIAIANVVNTSRIQDGIKKLRA